MRSAHGILKILLFLQGIILSLLCHAQTEKQLTPADIKQQTIVTEPVTLRKGFFRAGSLINYRVADKHFTGDGTKEYYQSNIWGSKSSYNITLQYGVSDRFEIELMGEYMNSLQESQTTEYVAATNSTKTVVAKQKGSGIGDSYLMMKYQILPEKKYMVSLTGNLNITVPTGEKNPKDIRSAEQYDLPVGNGTYAVAAGLCARSIVYPYSFTGYAGYTNFFPGKKKFNVTDVAETEFIFGNILEVSLGANLHLNEWIVFSNELNYQHKDKGKINSHDTPLLPVSWTASYEPGLVFQVRKFRLGESVTIPFKGKNVPADPLYIIMVQYIF